jgi:hypothetical protein
MGRSASAPLSFDARSRSRTERPVNPVFALDELELRPGMLEPFRAALAREYRPLAEARGMTLLHTWVTPPIELAAGGTRVVLVWQLAGVEGFWRMRAQSDPAPLDAWWRSCERFAVSRTRRFAADADALAELGALGRRHA